MEASGGPSDARDELSRSLPPAASTSRFQSVASVAATRDSLLDVESAELGTNANSEATPEGLSSLSRGRSSSVSLEPSSSISRQGFGSFDVEPMVSRSPTPGKSGGPGPGSRPDSQPGSRRALHQRTGSFMAAMRHVGHTLAGRSRSRPRAGPEAWGECPCCEIGLDPVTGTCRNCNPSRPTTLPPPSVLQEPPLGSHALIPRPPSFHAAPGLFSHPFCMFYRKARQGTVDSLAWGRDKWWFGSVIDPRWKWVRMWNRVFFAFSGLSLAAEPCYLYTVAFTYSSSCLYLQLTSCIVIASIMLFCNLVFILQTLFNLRMAFIPGESMALGRGELNFNAKSIVRNHAKHFDGLALDVIVLIPLSQVLVFALLPGLLDASRDGSTNLINAIGILFFVVVLQYCFKVYQTFVAVRRVQRVNGYLFGTIWWGFLLIFIVFLISAHTFGAIWYNEALSSAVNCLISQCDAEAAASGCTRDWLVCSDVLSMGPPAPWTQETAAWGGPGSNASVACFTTNQDTSYNYGIYNMAVQLLQDASPAEKIMFGLFFGIMTMATFGNALVPSPDLGQALFSWIMVVSGLLLFTALIGNMDVFLHSATSKEEDLHAMRGEMAWWMRKRQLPEKLQARVRQQQRLMLVATRGIDEDTLLEKLPSCIRRDVKRYLCSDLVRGVPLFSLLDDRIVDSICSCLRPCVHIVNSGLLRQGEPVEEMIFIMRGTIRSSHVMRNGDVSECDLCSGSFCGEELLSWALARTPEEHRLPMATATLTAFTIVEAFSLSAQDLCFITSHFRFQLRAKKIRQMIKYYSPHWRTWAAVTIQLCYRRWKKRALRRGSTGVSKGGSGAALGPEASRGSEDNLERSRLGRYAPFIFAPKPHDSMARSGSREAKLGRYSPQES